MSETSSDQEERAAIKEGNRVIHPNQDNEEKDDNDTNNMPKEEEMIREEKEGDIEDRLLQEEDKDAEDNEPKTDKPQNSLVEAEQWRGFILAFGMIINFVTKVRGMNITVY